ncbi:MAG TPA: diacylglycerol kinase family protein [Gemmataceae bacterium]|nr:diacylglycerol kinase family protein [Gemmataceae bacterium]
MNECGKVCVLFNPVSGRGKARRFLRSIEKELSSQFVLQPLTGPGCGVAQARQAVEEGFSTIIAAGGDGTIHEVANGIMETGNSDVVLGIWPMGSANDYAFNFGIKEPWKNLHREPVIRNVDVAVAETEHGAKRYYVNCMGVGFNGAVTVEARKIPWLRGMPLYGLGILQAMRRQFAHPIMKVRFDEQIREAPTLALSINIGKREGGFPLTPDADPCDGLFDYLQAGPLSRWELLRQLPNMATGNIPKDNPKVWTGRCRSASIESEAPLRVHVDGEFLCHPEDGVRNIQVKMLPGALRVRVE